MIDKDVILGRSVKIFNRSLVNLFGCRIGDETFIGPFVEIARGVNIGKRCTISSHSYICAGVEIGDGVFIGHGVMFTNDLYPRASIVNTPLKTVVEEGVSIGTNATMLCGIKVGRYTIVGAGAVVVKNMPSFSIVAGNPARTLKRFQNFTAMSRYINNRQKAKVRR